MVKAKRKLNFGLLPSVESTSLFARLNYGVEKKMMEIDAFDEALDRARGAAMLFGGASGDKSAWENEAYLRAGLGEFASITHALKRGLEKNTLKCQAYQIEDSQNPLLHLMLILRNVNFHAYRNKTSRANTTIYYHDKKEEQARNISVEFILDVSLELVLRKREIKNKYDKEDLERIIEWFNIKQLVFGAGSLFSEGVNLFCGELLDKYDSKCTRHI